MSPRQVPPGPGPITGSLPRPGKALGSVMIALLAIWILFAVFINWGGGGEGVFTFLAGNTGLVLHGQVWRVFTAPFLHLPQGDGAVSHMLTTLLGLFFLAPSLEKRWGPKKLLAFLYGAAVTGFVFQIIVEATLGVIAPSIAARFGQSLWFGAVGAVEAVAIAWALSFRGQTVNLMFVLPVSTKVLVIFVVGLSVARLLAGGTSLEGLFSPFGAMLFGWLVGGDPSPFGRWMLKRKLRSLTEQKKKVQTGRNIPPHLRVIEGSRGSGAETPTDKRWLN